MKILKAKEEIADVNFLYYVMDSIKFSHNEHKRYWISQYSKIKIPLPPLEIQKKIAGELKNFQEIVSGAKNILENYKPNFKIDSKWDLVELSDIITILTPPIKIQKSKFKSDGKFPIIDQSKEEIAGYTNNEKDVLNLEKPVIIFGDHTCVVKYFESSFAQGADGIKILNTKENIIPKYLYFFLISKSLKSEGYNRHFSKLKRIKVPIPPLEIQEKIISKIEEELKLINQNKELIKIFKKKIKDKVSEIWNN